VAESLAILYNDGQIPSTEPGSITITGHSGAYLGIAACLKHGGLSEHVNEVYLLDASYGRLGDITDWIIANPSARFGSIFTNHLADENVIMMSHLSRAGVPFSVRVDDALDSESERERVLFLYTLGLDHNGAVSWLERFLRAGTASAPAP
jgi:hypothetical protein